MCVQVYVKVRGNELSMKLILKGPLHSASYALKFLIVQSFPGLWLF